MRKKNIAVYMVVALLLTSCQLPMADQGIYDESMNVLNDENETNTEMKEIEDSELKKEIGSEEVGEKEKSKSEEDGMVDTEETRPEKEETPDTEETRSEEEETPDTEESRPEEEETPDTEETRPEEEKTPDTEESRPEEEETPDTEETRTEEEETPDTEEARPEEEETSDPEEIEPEKEKSDISEETKAEKDEQSEKEKETKTDLENENRSGNITVEIFTDISYLEWSKILMNGDYPLPDHAGEDFFNESLNECIENANIFFGIFKDREGKTPAVEDFYQKVSMINQRGTIEFQNLLPGKYYIIPVDPNGGNLQKARYNIKRMDQYRVDNLLGIEMHLEEILIDENTTEEKFIANICSINAEDYIIAFSLPLYLKTMYENQVSDNYDVFGIKLYCDDKFIGVADDIIANDFNIIDFTIASVGPYYDTLHKLKIEVCMLDERGEWSSKKMDDKWRVEIYPENIYFLDFIEDDLIVNCYMKNSPEIEGIPEEIRENVSLHSMESERKNTVSEQQVYGMLNDSLFIYDEKVHYPQFLMYDSKGKIISPRKYFTEYTGDCIKPGFYTAIVRAQDGTWNHTFDFQIVDLGEAVSYVGNQILDKKSLPEKSYITYKAEDLDHDNQNELLILKSNHLKQDLPTFWELAIYENKDEKWILQDSIIPPFPINKRDEQVHDLVLTKDGICWQIGNFEEQYSYLLSYDGSKFVCHDQEYNFKATDQDVFLAGIRKSAGEENACWNLVDYRNLSHFISVGLDVSCPMYFDNYMINGEDREKISTGIEFGEFLLSQVHERRENEDSLFLEKCVLYDMNLFMNINLISSNAKTA